MDTEVEVERSDERKFEESGAGKSSSFVSAPNDVADPVVYKLVRVEGDGRLVPATDDEVKEVEVLLTGCKSEMHIVEDIGQAVGCTSNEGSSSGIPLLETSEGFPSSENAQIAPNKLNARLEYIEEMLQRVKEEERLHLACGSPDYTSAYVIVDSQCSDQHDKLPGMDEKLQSEPLLQGTVTSLEKSLNGSCMIQSGSAGECSNPSDKIIQGGLSSTCTIVETSRPDFSKLNGEICLDTLSIRELHETFKATFGRDSTVKDKQWLMRRIAMGLTNSYDVSTTPYIIKDRKLVENCEKSYLDCSLANDPAVGRRNRSKEVSPVCHGSQLVDHQTVSGKRLRNQIADDNCGSNDNLTEEGAARRVRKPTRRYIEELSEAEDKDSSGRMNPAKSAELVSMFPKSHVMPVRNVSSDGKIVSRRFDSLGVSGIEVPCVSRVRRSRPRKNFMALLKFDPSSIGMAATFVKELPGAPSFQPGDGIENEVKEASSSPELVQHGLIGEPVKDEQVSVMGAGGSDPDLELKDAGSSDSDDKVAIVPTIKGGIRRKHHRAWTLSEVMMLVDGVARFGPGKWSEIKRLSFASYSYRTSVDLKDKWRNLLKASIVHTPPDKAMNSRKTAGSVPIPEAILLRVRELAEMQAQSPPNYIASKLAAATTVTTTMTAATAITTTSVQNKQAGFL